MTQGFDEWFLMYRPSLDTSAIEAEFIYEAGAASRQAEIDELQNDLIKAAEGQMKLFEHNNELQKRIDDALDYVFGLYCTGDLDTERLENILKGERNE